MRNQLLTLMLGVTILAAPSVFAGADRDRDGSKKTAIKLKTDYRLKNIRRNHYLLAFLSGPLHFKAAYHGRWDVRLEPAQAYPQIKIAKPKHILPKIIENKTDNLD